MIRVLRILVLVLLTTMGLPPALAAQGSSLAGIDGERLVAGRDSLEVFAVRGRDTVRTGMVWDELSLTMENDRTVLLRVYRSRDRVLGMRLDSIIDEHASLRPIRHRSRTNRAWEMLEFAGDAVTGWTQEANGDSVRLSADLPPAVHNASSLDLVLRAAPLQDGWSARVPVFIPSSRQIVALDAAVTGKDTVGSLACWRVEVDFLGMPVTFWVEENTRKLCQQVMQLEPGTQILFRRIAPQTRPMPTITALEMGAAPLLHTRLELHFEG